MEILEVGGVSIHFIICSIIISFVFRHVQPTGLLNTDTDLTLPIEFKQLDGTNFRIYKRRFAWETAFVFCSKCVGNFASFENPDSVNSVRDAIYKISHFSKEYDEDLKKEEFGLDRRYWVGLHDQKNLDGIWKWVSNLRDNPQAMENHKDYPWYTNQPDHRESYSANNREHCAGFWNPVYHLDDKPNRSEKHTFNDMPCDHKYYFICEKVDPPPYEGSAEPEFCKIPTAEKFVNFFGKIPTVSVEKAAKFLEQEASFENVTVT